LSTAFLLHYYTDVAGIPAAAVGTMFLRRATLGRIRRPDRRARAVDRTMTRWDKFRPFLLFSASRCCSSLVVALAANVRHNVESRPLDQDDDHSALVQTQISSPRTSDQ
jgi:hypothetical protein